jgi:hypothetical protein
VDYKRVVDKNFEKRHCPVLQPEENKISLTTIFQLLKSMTSNDRGTCEEVHLLVERGKSRTTCTIGGLASTKRGRYRSTAASSRVTLNPGDNRRECYCYVRLLSA